MSKRRPGTLSDDDLEIWRKVARSARPLDTRGTAHPAPKVVAKREPPSFGGTARQDDGSGLSAFRIGEVSRQPDKSHEMAPTIERSLSAMPLRMDKKAFGRLKRGKLRPERKLDLHGMTLAQAHPQLVRFIRTAHAEGCRLVIVVTGKGRSGKDEGGPIPTPRGVLRHQVPLWLHAPPLRALVLQVTDAHARHGGTGAYYVYLARG